MMFVQCTHTKKC